MSLREVCSLLVAASQFSELLFLGTRLWRSWRVFTISLHIALNMTPNMVCYRVGQYP